MDIHDTATITKGITYTAAPAQAIHKICLSGTPTIGGNTSVIPTDTAGNAPIILHDYHSDSAKYNGSGFSVGTGNAGKYAVQCVADADTAAKITCGNEGFKLEYDGTNKAIKLTKIDIIFENGEGTVEEDASLSSDLTIPVGTTLTIPAGKTLTIPAGKTLTNNGTIIVEGTLINGGTLNNTNGTVKVGENGEGIGKGSGASRIAAESGTLKNIIKKLLSEQELSR